MAVSRWERGETEPAAESYIRLGNLAGDPLCSFFWARAGLSTADVMRVLPTAGRRLRAGRIASVNLVHAGAPSLLKPQDFVAIPLLPIRAATPGAEGDEVADLDQLKPEAMWAAPAQWCPNPRSTISLRVIGNSMSPLILDGYVVALDTSTTSRDDLVGKIVVAWNPKEKALLLSRLIRFDHTEALVSEFSARLLKLQDEERRRIARELHDGVGQLLAAQYTAPFHRYSGIGQDARRGHS